MAKKLWNIFHVYDVDGGFGDPVAVEDLVATVEATDDEIKEFVEKWNKPEYYEHPYCYLECHKVYAREAQVKTIQGLEPYSIDPDDWMNRGIQDLKAESE